MANFLLKIVFDGTNYHGWQLQKNGVTVQEVLGKAIESITGAFPTIHGCSRTDAGVHARAYFCSFKSDTSIPAEKLPSALNSRLPDDVVALDASIVDDDFNARFRSKGKKYIYRIWNGGKHNPLLRLYSAHVRYPLDELKMAAAADMLCGTHDFAGFMAAGGDDSLTVRTVDALTVSREGDEVVIEISAKAYLYNMVRIIAGTLVYVGMGKILLSEVPSIIESRDRTRAGKTMPPQGLTLWDVWFA